MSPGESFKDSRSRSFPLCSVETNFCLHRLRIGIRHKALTDCFFQCLDISSGGPQLYLESVTKENAEDWHGGTTGERHAEAEDDQEGIEGS